MAQVPLAVEWGLDSAFTTRLEPATVEDVNDLSGRDVATIDDGSVDDGVWWRLPYVPAELIAGSAPLLVVVVKTPATSGAFRFLCNYRSIKVPTTGESGDPSTWQGTPNSGNVTVPGTARLLLRLTMALTIGDLAEADMIVGECLRQLSNAGDTVADVAVIDSLYMEYTA